MLDIEKVKNREAIICIIGLGYVGLPTAVHFAEKGFKVIGVDKNQAVVNTINSGKSHLVDLDLGDRVSKLVHKQLLSANSDTISSVKSSDIIIIVVPTPVTKDKHPDPKFVQLAAEEIVQGLSRDKLVILESTVYPGLTEEILQPILESKGLTAGTDFGLAYCPERYNPGDPNHSINDVQRIVGGITPEWAEVTKELYTSIVDKPVTVLKNIKTTEAAKVIENVQRDVNIALVNELALIFEKLGVDVIDVINGAATKWNFHKYSPGPGVGGHCIPVDPYYLIEKARKAGVEPKLITTGREINNFMPHHTFQLLKNEMNDLNGKNIVVLGYSYKPNVGDPRETPADYLLSDLNSANANTIVIDPFINTNYFDAHSINHANNLNEIKESIDAIVLMTGHDVFKSIDFSSIPKTTVIIDGCRLLDSEKIIGFGLKYVGIGAGDVNAK